MVNTCASIVINRNALYPTIAPFDASERYPEFAVAHISDEKNDVYDMVRQALIDIGMDKENMSTGNWSPFRDLVKPGNTVVIKPNMVFDTLDPSIQNCTTTHPSVLRPIIDYCWKALEGRGEIIVGDCPAAEADFKRIITRTKYDDMVYQLEKRGIPVSLKDFRAVRVVSENGIWVHEQSVTQDKSNCQIVALDSESLLVNRRHKQVKYHGAGYDIKSTNRHHNGSTHRYCISRKILQADVIISVPKFKTHSKAGITCCLKNIVGINADKNYLPHFTIGGVNMGGDEMPPISKNRVFLMHIYNWLREHVIAYTWRVIGKPAAAMLRIAFKDNGSDITQSVDLPHTLHTKISKQSVTAGAWPGNETICAKI